MIVSFVDVPLDAPQTLAFRVATGELGELREALRAAYERADPEPLERRWRGGRPAYRRARERVRWRVPATSARALAGELRRAIERRESTPTDDGMLIPGEGALETLAAQCDRLEGLAGDRPHIDLDPARWIRAVTQIRFRVRPYLAVPGAQEPLNFEWGYWAARLAEIDQPPASLDPDPYGEEAGPEAIAATRQVRYFVEDYDEASRESRRGPEVTFNRLDNLMRDFAVLADGFETSPDRAYGRAESAMRLRGQLELLVGPWVPSSGPGPFLDAPRVARPIVDPGWDLLEVYRARDGDPDLGWQPPGWRFASGDALAAALDELASAAPERGDCFDDWGRAHASGWIGWDDAIELHWDRCRERYRALLSAAHQAGDSVVFGWWGPDDQGTISAPLEPDLGERYS